MSHRRGGKALPDARSRNRFLIHGAAVAAFSYLTSGVYLSGLAISVGAGDVLVGYFSIILNICGVLTLAFSALLERFQSRKRLAIWLTVLSRAVTVLIVAIPAVAPKSLRLPLLLLTVVVAFTLQAQTTVVLNQWMLCFVDRDKGGRYISMRQTVTMAVTVVLSLAGGWYMDFMGGGYSGFVVLFGMAGAFGVMEVVLLAKIPDHGAEGAWASPSKLRELLKIPLRDGRFFQFIGNIFFFYLLLTLADSFTMVYMMKYLALPYQTVTALQLIMALPQVVLLGVWGRISDRWGHARVLKVSIALFVGEMLFLSMASPETWFFCIPAGFFIAAVANAGFAVAVFNRRYELMPAENRIAYDNVYTAAIGGGSILGPLLGGLLKDGFGHISGLSDAIVFGDIRLLYVVAAVGILLVQAAFGRREKKEKN